LNQAKPNVSVLQWLIGKIIDELLLDQLPG
jgi:hypothetical protein